MAVLRHAGEVTGNLALTCRYFGISRPTFDEWRQRYEEHGPEGLRDRSSAPHHSPNALFEYFEVLHSRQRHQSGA